MATGFLFQVEIFVPRRQPLVGSTSHTGHAGQPEGAKPERQCTGKFAAGHCQPYALEIADVTQKQAAHTAHRNNFVEVPLRGKYVLKRNLFLFVTVYDVSLKGENRKIPYPHTVFCVAFFGQLLFLFFLHSTMLYTLTYLLNYAGRRAMARFIITFDVNLLSEYPILKQQQTLYVRNNT